MSWMLNALRSAVTPRPSTASTAVATAPVESEEIASVIALDDDEELTLAPEEDEPSPVDFAPVKWTETTAEMPEVVPPDAASSGMVAPVAETEDVIVVSEVVAEESPSIDRAASSGDEIPELESLLEAVFQLEEAARLAAPARHAVSEDKSAACEWTVAEAAVAETGQPETAVAAKSDRVDPEPAPVTTAEIAPLEPANCKEEPSPLPPLEFVPMAVCSHPEVLESLLEDGYASSEEVAVQQFAEGDPRTLSISILPPGEWQDLPEREPTSCEPEPVEIDVEVEVAASVESPLVAPAPAPAIPTAIPEAAPAPSPSSEARPATTRLADEPAPRLSLDYRFREIAERSSQGPSPLEVELAAILDDPQQGPPLRRAAHSILLQIPTGASRVILLTGADDEPHTSHVAGALAMILATEERARTLLIDAQPAARRLSQGFGLEKAAGLAEALRGRQEASAVVVTTATDRLALAPYGSGPVERTGEAWETLLTDLRHHRDFVVVDARADIARHLARLAEGIFLIVRRGQTDGDAAAKVVQDLRAAGGRVLGCVLTNAACGA